MPSEPVRARSAPNDGLAVGEGLAGSAGQPLPLTQDAEKFLRLMLEECPGRADGDHIWQKCPRCLAIFEMDTRKPLARRYLLEALRCVQAVTTHAALVEGLRTYGQHKLNCRINVTRHADDSAAYLSETCTCGFDALLAHLETRA